MVAFLLQEAGVRCTERRIGLVALCRARLLASKERRTLSFGCRLRFLTSAMPRGDAHGGAGKTFEPLRGKHTATLVWLHGLGDTADGWSSAVPELRLSSTRVILPTADTVPVTLNFGTRMPAWADIYSLSENAREDREGILRSVSRILKIVEEECTNEGVRPERIFLGGFSQGGAIALQAYLRSERDLGGFAGLSTWLALRNEVFAAVPKSRRKGRIALWHGDQDEIVNYHWGVHSAELLRQNLAPGFEVSFRTVQGLGHAVDREEFAELRKTLQEWTRVEQ
jgi:predicted esterase